MPAYNAAMFIQDAINSVFNQTYHRFELIVIDDGSTDDTLQIIKQIKDSRIVVIQQENRGVSAARNLGISRANGKYLVFLDADDVMENYTLSTYVKHFDDVDFILGEYAYMGGMMNGKIAHDLRDYPDDRDGLFEKLLSGNYIGIGAVCLRNGLMERYFDESLRFGEDYDLWLRVMRETSRVKLIKKSLYRYRVDEASAYHKKPYQDFVLAEVIGRHMDYNEKAGDVAYH